MFRFYGLLGMILSCQLHAIEGGKLSDLSLMLKTGTVAVLIPTPKKVKACTGVRVAPNVVLTAAHCIVRHGPIGIRQALHHLDETVSVEEISQVFMPLRNYYYRNYFTPEHGDVAVLVLKKDSPAPFVKIKAFSISDRSYIQLGYGQTSLDSKENSVLHYLEDSKVKLDKGARTLDVVPNSLTSGLLPGDSGGPILTMEKGEYFLVGTTISTEAYTFRGQPRRSTYNATASYLMWIRNAVNKKEFQNKLKAKKPQYEADDLPTSINDDNRSELLREACQGMSTSYPVKWELNQYLSCLPQDRDLCLDVKSGRFGIGVPNFYLEWNETNRTCSE